MTPLLSTKALNRALLARQLLLERHAMGIPDALTHLAGLQAQATNAPYHGLWSRLADFRQQTLTELILDKTVVRTATLRATLHLHTAADALAFRPLVQAVFERGWKAAYAKRFGAADPERVRAIGIAHLDRDRLTNGGLAALLAPDFPASEPLALAQYVHAMEALAQVPPTRLWNSGHAPLLERMSHYLPGMDAPVLTRSDLVLRYLRAFGPASIADMQAWSGLTRLKPDFEAVRGQLEVFVDDTGRELFDLPDAPRPGPDVPAPIRFIPEFDNIFLGHADRRRIVSDAVRPKMFVVNRYHPPILIDGMIEGGWRLERVKDAVRLRFSTYAPAGKTIHRQIAEEGERFARFCHSDAQSLSVAFDPDLLVQ